MCMSVPAKASKVITSLGGTVTAELNSDLLEKAESFLNQGVIYTAPPPFLKKKIGNKISV